MISTNAAISDVGKQPIRISMKRNRLTEPLGISRLEVIIAIVIVAVIVANIFPAIVFIREKARGQACKANLRQIGTALHAYANLHRMLPPAAVWSTEGLDLNNFYKDGRPMTVTHGNWAQLILPFLGEMELANKFDTSTPVTAAENEIPRTSILPIFRCGSDENQRVNNPFVLTLDDGSDCRFSRGNYAINGGSQHWGRAPGDLLNPRPNASQYEFDSEARRFAFYGVGVAGINRPFALDEFTNGQSSLVAVDEVRAGVHPIDPRGVWALGQIGASITWGHGAMGDAGGPNPSMANADDIANGPKLHKLIGADQLKNENMPCCDHCNQNQQAGARSRHAGGVNGLMLDGAVRFFANSMDVGLWEIIHSRETPASIADNDLRRAESKSPVSSTTSGAVSDLRRLPRNRKQNDLTLVNSLEQHFVSIPAGEFTMGLPNQGNSFLVLGEAPPHPVQISTAYYLGIHEVTQSEYMVVMETNPSWHSPTGEGANRVAKTDTAVLPVENVTWYEAQMFCERLSERAQEKEAGRRYRLPTEAEWEYACRSGEPTPYPPPIAWDKRYGFQFADKPSGTVPHESELIPAKVGTFGPNQFGVYDMCENVYEWTADWFAADYYSISPQVDPPGPIHGSLKVIRGWHWVFTGPACKTNMATAPSGKSRFVGFRIVCEIDQ